MPCAAVTEPFAGQPRRDLLARVLTKEHWMRAVVQGGVHDLRLVDMDEPRSEGTARIRTCAVGICGSDLHLHCSRAEPQSRPGGHEIDGKSSSCPTGYRGPLAVGDLVALDAICLGIVCGVCEYCLAGVPVDSQQARFSRSGGFAEVFECKPDGCSSCPGSAVSGQRSAVSGQRSAVSGQRSGAVLVGGGGGGGVHREPLACRRLVFETVGGTAAGLEQPLARELMVIFSNCYISWDGSHDFEVAIDLLARGVVPTERIVTHRFSLEWAPEAFKTADDKSSGSVKVQLQP